MLVDLPRLVTLSGGSLAEWHEALPAAIADRMQTQHGDLAAWRAVISDLPPAFPSSVDLTASAIRIGTPADCDATVRSRIRELLLRLRPWRKGPFDVFGMLIDTEWRSDWKWDRLKDHVARLEGRMVLDVGCGSGYHCLRAAGAGARLVVGVEPTLLYVYQYQALRRYLDDVAVFLVPLPLELVPPVPAFDTVFSMGVVYHRRAPLEHLSLLRRLLRPGGELVLESLVVEGDADTILVPAGRYARMGNVHCVPSAARLLAWLAESGYGAARVVDVAVTTSQEQRSTEWMTFESLAAGLDPRDSTRTIEGHPAPRRALVIAEG